MLLLLLLLGTVAIGVVPLVRWWEGRTWMRSLVAFLLHLPAGLRAEDVARWLAGIAAGTHPPGWSLLPLPPVAMEATASAAGIAHYLLASRQAEAKILAGLRASLPGARITEAPDYLTRRPEFRLAGEVGLTDLARPLAAERAEAVSRELLAAMQPVSAGSEIRVQWIMTSAGTPRPALRPSAGGSVRDAEAARAAQLKYREPLLQMVGRIGVAAPDDAEARMLFGRVWGTLHGLNAPGVRIIRRWLPSSVVTARLAVRAIPVLRWPLILNVREAAGLVGLPAGGAGLPGLVLGLSRQMAPAPHMPTHGAVVAMSNFPGMTDRPLTLAAEDRLRHIWVNAPTGGGKSTLLARMALQDIRAGYGVVIIDPKNDMAEDILSRIPPNRQSDVIALSPGDLMRPIGFNILRAGRDEHSRERVVDNVVHLFSEIWSGSWGPRTSDVLRSVLLTLTHTRAADGSAFTLCEVPELLLNDAFRRSVTRQPSVPDSVRSFWATYEQMSDSERAQVIGPSMNKIRSLTSRTPLRLLLGQSEGCDLTEVFTKRRILVAKLSKGIVGEDTASLVGALLISSLWQAALSRMAIPASRRRPVFGYLDEFTDLVRLPVPLADVLAQARGLGLGLTLASQYADQLPDAVKAAVLGTVRTQITMQCEFEDSRLLARRFAPLTSDGLMGLAAYEVAMRPCVGGQTLAPVTGRTLPLDPATGDAATLASGSHARFGMDRADVEAALASRLQPSARPTIGRNQRGGQP